VAGTTVRSLRVLQDRRLLPPPELRGRTGYYDDHHVARVRLVLRLQARGYTLAAIHELLSAWETGRDLADVLGLEAAGSPSSLGEPVRQELQATAERVAESINRLAAPSRAAVATELAPALEQAVAQYLSGLDDHRHS
jgi:DNA-binding transcriptional MerR regulator